MKRIKRLASYLALTKSESVALVVIASLYLVGFTWRYIQKTTAPFDAAVYAELDSLIAVGGLVPSDTLPKARSDSLKSDSPGVDTLAAQNGGTVDINEASLRELIGLPGIGPALAGRILEYRERHGPFERAEDLVRVKGIGRIKLERIRGLIVVR